MNSLYALPFFKGQNKGLFGIFSTLVYLSRHPAFLTEFDLVTIHVYILVASQSCVIMRKYLEVISKN